MTLAADRTANRRALAEIHGGDHDATLRDTENIDQVE
jgi:hypothetical protein